MSVATSSGSLAATGAVAVAGNSGRLTCLMVNAGADAATATVYDNTTNSGTIIAKLSAAINTSEAIQCDVVYNKGIYIVITGTTPVVIAHTVRG